MSAQDAANCRVRVTFPDHDQMQSWWLAVVVAKTQTDKAYHLPDLGEQVVCIMDERDEDGVVLGALYSTVDTPPAGLTADTIQWQAGDGAIFAYDRAQHALQMNLPAGGTVVVSSGAASIQIDSLGNVNISSGGLIRLGAGAQRGVARIGDTVTCPAGVGTITSASAIVEAV